MPQPYKRSRSLRRLNIKATGKTVLRYVERKPGKAKCGNCGTILKGIIRERSSRMRKMPKTRKSAARPYGGNLCSKCMRAFIIEKARVQ